MVPREHGGDGGTFSELMKVVIAISAGDSNIGQMYQLHTGGIRLMQEFASPAVQAKWLPRFTRELWIANAYSEVGTKSVNDFNTTVTRDGDGWRLNGRKFYCTGSLAGDITFGPCRIDGTDEVRVFFTPTDAAGVTIHDDWTGFGQRTTASGTTEFHEVDPRRAVPGQPGHRGRRRRRGDLAELPGGAHRRVRGIASNALDDAVEFVQTRARLWYESPADQATDDLYTQLRVGEMKTAVDAAELLSLRPPSCATRPSRTRATSASAARRPWSPARRGRRRRRRRCSPGPRCSRCAARAACWRSTASTGTGATPARCPCTTRWTSSRCTPATSCSTTAAPGQLLR